MKYHHILPIAMLAPTYSSALGQTVAEGYRPLFNGTDLADRNANLELWSVADGCITGRTKGSEHHAGIFRLSDKIRQYTRSR